MTEHPAKDCTPAQIEMFERIALRPGGGGYYSPRTLAALMRKGLVESVSCAGTIYNIPKKHLDQWRKRQSESEQGQ